MNTTDSTSDRTFRCQSCDAVFVRPREWSEADAAERNRLFALTGKPFATLCEPCFQGLKRFAELSGMYEQ